MTSTWLVGATVVDGSGHDPVANRSIEIADGRIASVGSKPPPGSKVIDCTGLTMTPGLIDAHVHLGLSSSINDSLRGVLSVAEIAADMFANCTQTLDAGFTTVRDTGGIDGGLAHVVATGKVPGPRILQCGPVHCQTGGHGYTGYAPDWEPSECWDQHAVPGLRTLSMLSDGPDELRKNVRESFRRGADFIKLCVTGGVVSSHDRLTDTQFTIEEIQVAVAEASARGTYVTVHAHNNNGIHNAVSAGVKCVEHASDLDEQTAALMAAHDVAHVPTLAVAEALMVDATTAGLDPSIGSRVGDCLQGMKDAVAISRQAGLRVGLGSDLIGPRQNFRGRELLLRAELETPMDALVAATRVNADIIGIGDDVGTITTGKRADLTLFRDSPLDDPQRFEDREQVVLVLQDGRIVKDQR